MKTIIKRLDLSEIMEEEFYSFIKNTNITEKDLSNLVDLIMECFWCEEQNLCLISDDYLGNFLKLEDYILGLQIDVDDKTKLIDYVFKFLNK